ncbi:prolipoprotein diacylglyceryl transferase [Amylibacter sp. IMCC11727]|uniref:prolipoprotein diacylglyceryl transferase n=1 Tax=Amylibacter sp. IMCC11727 TaxID=3039851 RepID=UPI00244E1A63|nr:prolipoprotein diacylglyceryl transferase [Amylibacter sp. IMCC11727]WGI21001.1 prolipoprotein diacylglyceryl transferase [Amylibacter sp. IMCC11727]
MIAALPFPNIDPVLWSVDIGGFTLAIRWYALAYIAGFLLAWWWGNRAIRNAQLWVNDTAPMTLKHAEDFLTWAIVGVIIGGRLGWVLFYSQGAWLDDPTMIYKVWEGGMSFHGGFLGVVVVAILFARKYKIPVLSLADILALGVPIGLGLGRLANFINAELWGKPTTAPWGVVFPNTPDCPLTWLDPVCARHPSQLYEAILEGIVLFALLAYLAYRRGWLKTPGALAGVFFMGYGAARFFVEFFRQGDAQFTSATNPWGHILRLGQEVDSIGFTMGQLLSLPMIAVGLLLLIYARRTSSTT